MWGPLPVARIPRHRVPRSALGCPRIGSFLLALSQWCTLLTAVECVRGWWFGSVVTLRGTLGVGVGSFPVDRGRAPRSALCLCARIGRAVTFSGTLCAQVSSRRPLPADWKLEVPLPSVVHNALKRGFSSGDASLFPPVSAQIRTAQCALALEGGLSSGDASFFPPVSAQIGTACYPGASNLCYC